MGAPALVPLQGGKGGADGLAEAREAVMALWQQLDEQLQRAEAGGAKLDRWGAPVADFGLGRRTCTGALVQRAAVRGLGFDVATHPPAPARTGCPFRR